MQPSRAASVGVWHYERVRALAWQSCNSVRGANENFVNPNNPRGDDYNPLELCARSFQQAHPNRQYTFILHAAQLAIRWIMR
jgi:hypothetical protein